MQLVHSCIILLKVDERKVTLNGEPGTVNAYVLRSFLGKIYMNDPDDKILKAEIDEIMENVYNILKKVESLDPVKSKESKQNEN